MTTPRIAHDEATQAAVSVVLGLAATLHGADATEHERITRNIRYAIEQNAARQFAYGAQTNNFKVPQVTAKNELSQDDAELLMQCVERAIKYDVLPNYRAAFLLEQALLAAHAKEPIKWGRLRYAHIDDFAEDIKAVMDTPPRLPKNTVSYYSPSLDKPIKHVETPVPAPVPAPTLAANIDPFTGKPYTPATVVI